MSYNRSPLFEPQPPPAQKPPQNEVKKTSISPIAQYVGDGNMPLVWTMLALVAFVAFVIFYIIYNPLPESIEYSATHGSNQIASVPPAGTPRHT